MDEHTKKYDKKSIRAFAIRLLRQRIPEYIGLPRKMKREKIKVVTRAIRDLLTRGSTFDGVPEMSQSERLGLGQLPSDPLSLKEVERMMEDSERTLIDLRSRLRSGQLKDELLKYIDEQLDDRVLNQLLARPGFTPTMRTWMPSDLFRTELLQTLKYPTISARLFCGLLGQDKKKYAEERAFCGMFGKNKSRTINHTTLSSFRSSLTLSMRINLMVYVMALFFRSGRLGEGCVFALDSTDVATKNNPRPLDKVKMPDGSFIRFYADLDSDCGSRRTKRDKSKQFVGYRVHTLCAVDVESEIAFPMLSLAVAANHHDSQMLAPLVNLARAIGLEMKVLLGDDAYADVKKQEELLADDGISLLTPDREETAVPENVDPVTGDVRLTPECPVPMRWDGFDKEDKAHVFVCSDENRDCFFQHRCPKERLIPVDGGLMRPIPNCVEQSETAMALRKVTERPFNLMKHMDGLEPCPMKNMHSVSSQVVFSQIAGLFRAMAGLRSRKKSENEVQPKQEVMNL